jgi:hypothetical protein
MTVPLATDRSPLRHAFPRGRLFFLVATPALAWSAQGLLGWYIASLACQRHHARLGSLSAGGTRALLLVLSLVALGASLAALATAWRDRRRFAGEDSSPAATLWESIDFLATAGILMGVALSIGIFWAGLPSILVQVCGEIR